MKTETLLLVALLAVGGYFLFTQARAGSSQKTIVIKDRERTFWEKIGEGVGAVVGWGAEAFGFDGVETDEYTPELPPGY